MQFLSSYFCFEYENFFKVAPHMMTGFSFSCLTVDATTIVKVNVRGDSEVGVPLTRSMDPIPSATFLDEHGMDNLIIPIAVSPAREEGTSKSFIVDCVVHPMLTERCVPAHCSCEHFLRKLTILCAEWILKENGLRLELRTLKKHNSYFGSAPSGGQMNDSMKEMESLLKEAQKMSTSTEKNDPDSFPQELIINTPTTGKEGKKPLVVDMDEEKRLRSGIKKGFLKSNELYGKEGTSEGTAPEMDPLAHIPQSLRDKCHIVDTTAAPETAVPMPKEQKRVATWKYELNRLDSAISIRISCPPSVKSMSDIEDISIDRDKIDIDYGRFTVDLATTPVDVDTAKAKFIKSSSTLIITCSTM